MKDSPDSTSSILLASQANLRPVLPTLRSRLRALGVACFVIAGVFCAIVAYVRIFTSQIALNRDYIEYWAQGQLLAHHADPFDPSAIYRVQHSAVPQRDTALISFSPPVALWLTLPLGHVSAHAGMYLWLFAQIASLSLALRALWILNGRPNSRWHLLGYLFAPVIDCEMVGQLSIFLLLCLVLFLLLHETHPFLAGALLTPFALKPHLLLPFALVLLIWAVLRSAYNLLVGSAVMLATSCALSLYVDPQAWSQYRRMMASSHVLQMFIPALPVVLRFAIDRTAHWIQFVPDICACTWAVGYFWYRRDRWDWRHNGLVVLLVSVVCAPYVWFFDQSIVLPAVLAGLYRALENRRSLLPLAVLGTVSLAEPLSTLKLGDYLWTTPAWLAWYLYASSKPRGPSHPRMASMAPPRQEFDN